MGAGVIQGIRLNVAHLSASRLQEVRDAVERLPPLYDAGTRAVFFASIDRRYVGLLPILGAPRVQLKSDLDRLNGQGRLTDGTVPIVGWLANAADLAGPTEDQKIFLAALDDVAHRVTGAPRVANPSALPEHKEAIIHQDDMLPHGFMVAGAAAGAAVAKLRIPRHENGVLVNAREPVTYLGTGWLVGKSLLVTNHHVINARNENEAPAGDADLALQASAAEVRFDFDDRDVQGNVVGVAKLAAWDPGLDYAVLKIADTKRKPLRIAPGTIKQARGSYTPVNIIQHPEGTSKKYAIRNNLVSAVSATDVRYFTDTRPGSSGAPVLDDAWQVVALHRGSSLARDVKFQGRSTAWVNVGTPIHAILEDLRRRFPKVHELLRP